MDNERINGIPEEETEEQAVQNEAAEETTAEISDPEQEETVAAETTDEVADNDEPKNTATLNEETEVSVHETEEAEPEAIDESELCTVCGENRKGEDGDYCPECEAMMLSRKTPFLGWLSGLLAIVCSVFALMLVLLVSAPSIQVARAEASAKDNCWYTAYKQYNEAPSIVEEVNGILGAETPFVQLGSGFNVKIIEAVANSYSPLDALSVADNLLGDDYVGKFRALKKYETIREDYLATYEALMEPIEAMTYGEADAATTYAAFEAAKSVEGVNPIFVNYFLYNAASYYNESDETKIKYLEAVDAANKESGTDYSWLYYQDYADLLYASGQKDKAAEYLNALTDSDKTKFGAYELKMRIAVNEGDFDKAKSILDEFKEYNEGYDTAYILEASFLRISGETGKAKELITEALEEYDSVPELHRQLALVYLVEGDYDSAYEEAFTADSNAYYLYAYMGDSSAYTPQLNNTLYLCTYLAKTFGTSSSENAVYFEDILDSFSEEDLSEQVLSVVNEEKTVAEVLTEGVCDLA